MHDHCYDIAEAVKTEDGTRTAVKVMYGLLCLFNMKERLSLLKRFCLQCGSINPNCQCQATTAPPL